MKSLLAGHGRRSRNRGAAEWRLTVGRLVLVYDYPDQGDPATACIVTLWRHR